MHRSINSIKFQNILISLTNLTTFNVLANITLTKFEEKFEVPALWSDSYFIQKLSSTVHLTKFII